MAARQCGHPADAVLRFVVTMMCTPGTPMLVLVDEDELRQRADQRVKA